MKAYIKKNYRKDLGLTLLLAIFISVIGFQTSEEGFSDILQYKFWLALIIGVIYLTIVLFPICMISRFFILETWKEYVKDFSAMDKIGKILTVVALLALLSIKIIKLTK